MLTIRHIHDGAVRAVDRSDLAATLREPGFVWLDLADPTPDEEMVLEEPVLGLEPLAIEDMREDVHLPKLDVFSDLILLTVHAIEVERSAVELSTSELDLAFGDHVLITYHAREIGAVNAAAAQIGTAGLDRPVAVVHRILDVMNDVFVPFLDLFGQRLDLVEEDVLEQPTASTRAEIFALRRDLVTLRRIAVPQAEVIGRLGRDRVPLLSDDDQALFRDVYDHLYRLAEVSEAYRQLVESAYDMYRSVRDDETNRRLTLLTMVSTVLLPISVLAGIYGMNFDHMPELDERWAYPALWAVFVAIIVVQLVVFRSWGWLGRRRAEEEMAERRRGLIERVEIPVLGQVLRVPAYGARFAVASGRGVFRLGRWLGRVVAERRVR